MKKQPRCTATRAATVTRACALVVLLLGGHSVNAAPIGQVTDSSGPLLTRTPDQALKVLAAGSAVQAGDTFFTRGDTYSQIRLEDNSSIILGPDSELYIERYSTDSVSIRLIGGRVRIASGLSGTPGSNSFILQAGNATLTIQRGTFIAEYTPQASGETAWQGPGLRQPRMAMLSSGHRLSAYRPVALRLAQNITPLPGARAPGLYVQVLDGMVNLSNSGGTQNFTAGQFGFVPNMQVPPVILPANPGLKFTPPPTFNTPSTSPNSSPPGKSGAVDCVVR